MALSILYVASLVTQALDRLDIAYVVGGSIARSFYGLARSTVDVDIVADIHIDHLPRLQEELSPHFYLDVQALLDAPITGSSFNLIHLESMYKVDIFLPKSRTFDRLQLQNAQYEQLSREPALHMRLAGPENTILAKLEWYRMGGEVSERQWRDVLEVMTLQWERLDWNYLAEMAAELGVGDLLARARTTCEA